MKRLAHQKTDPRECQRTDRQKPTLIKHPRLRGHSLNP